MNIQINFRTYRFNWLPKKEELCVPGFGFTWLWFNVNIWPHHPWDNMDGIVDEYEYD